jgi:methylmalonyl-CoA mutase
VVVETPGIGQGDAAIVPFCDVSLYVMTPEYGAASQLEKIDMLDFADVVAVNKYERRGAEDARRDVARQLVRNREAFGVSWQDMPVYGTSAARFDDDGVTALYQELRGALAGKGLALSSGVLPRVDVRASTGLTSVLPPSAVTYLGEVAATVRAHHQQTARQVEAARTRQHLTTARALLDGEAVEVLDAAIADAEGRLDGWTARALDGWPATVEQYAGDELVYVVRGKEFRTPLRRSRCPGTPVPRVALPRTTDHGELVRFLREEGLPGSFPFTAGVFPFKRTGEAPARMFAGEGDAFRTNRRFKLLSAGNEATRLSTAFDSVTLYGRDPDRRPDIHGKVGTSGVSIATLDDMKVLYDGLRPVLADDVGVDDDQRPGAGGPGDVHEHRHRPAARAPAGRRPEQVAAEVLRTSAARCRPTSSRRTRVRTPASSRPSSRCGAWPTSSRGSSTTRSATSTRSASPATTWPRPGRTRSASWRSRSRTASPTSRPTSPAAWRSTTSRRTCRSSSPTAWTPSTPCSAGSPGGSGRWRCATGTARGSGRRS